MKVSVRNVKVREQELTIFSTGVTLLSMNMRSDLPAVYGVTVTSTGPDSKRVEITLTPDELEKLMISYEKAKRWNTGDFSDMYSSTPVR